MIIQYLIATFLGILVADMYPPKYSAFIWFVVAASVFFDLVLRIGFRRDKGTESGLRGDELPPALGG